MDAKCSCAAKKRGTKGHQRKTATQLEEQQAEVPEIIRVKHFINSNQNQFVYITFCCKRLLQPTELGRNS